MKQLMDKIKTDMKKIIEEYENYKNEVLKYEPMDTQFLMLKNGRKMFLEKIKQLKGKEDEKVKNKKKYKSRFC